MYPLRFKVFACLCVQYMFVFPIGLIRGVLFQLVCLLKQVICVLSRALLTGILQINN